MFNVYKRYKRFHYLNSLLLAETAIISKKNCRTTSESEGPLFYKTNRFEWICLKWISESIRIANRNALEGTVLSVDTVQSVQKNNIFSWSRDSWDQYSWHEIRPRHWNCISK